MMLVLYTWDLYLIVCCSLGEGDGEEGEDESSGESVEVEEASEEGDSEEDERDEEDEKEDEEGSEDEEEEISEEAGSPGLAYLQKSNLEVRMASPLICHRPQVGQYVCLHYSVFRRTKRVTSSIPLEMKASQKISKTTLMKKWRDC